MHRAMGSLSTGTYLIIGSMNKQDHLPRVEREGTGHKLRSTENKQDENIEWHFESLGHNLVRIRNKKSGTAYRPLAFFEGALLDQECGPTVYMIEETETRGEYVSSLAENPAWYINPLGYGCGFKVSKEKAHWSFFQVEE